MKIKKLVVLISCVLLISCTENSISNAQVIENISVENFKNLMEQEQNEILIDVRTLQETASGHLQDATLIDYYGDDFLEKIAMVRKDVPIFIYCRSGGRSSSAAKKMQKMGFKKIYNLKGGIGAWNNAAYPLVKTSSIKVEKAEVISEKDFQAILSNNNIVLVDFHTKWCVPCKKLAPIIDEIAIENKEKLFVIKIDADVNKHLTKKYNAKGVPTLILFKNTKEVWRHTGLLSKKEIINQFD
ncbi:MAG: thioredoxin fold domain-containing protein [Flavobacteriales bacterium]|nr:thioredoxin fold domain-containing protein [Flavobacteriales bacterium]